MAWPGPLLGRGSAQGTCRERESMHASVSRTREKLGRIHRLNCELSDREATCGQGGSRKA